MSITRLSGGLTPADGSDPRTFPAIFNDVADTVESQGSAITGAESDIDALEADSIPTDVTSPVAGDKLVFDGTNFVNLEAFAFVGTVTFESNGTFEKGDFPFLRAIRVKCQGSGSAGGGVESTGSDDVAAGGGGASGSFSESFLTDIAGLGSSVTVEVGEGGLGVDEANGNAGSPSSFGALVIANGAATGGLRGRARAQIRANRGGIGGDTGVGDLVARGNGGGYGLALTIPTGQGGLGGASFFGGAGRGMGNNDGDGFVGSLGGGGGGANNRNSVATPHKGGDGGDGIVIVELFA